MKVNVDDRLVRRWMVLISSLVGIGWLGVTAANAANILFVVSTVNADGTPGPAQDLEVMTRLQGKGHTVTAAADQDAALGDLFAGKDLILISSSVGSGNQPLNALALDPLKPGLPQSSVTSRDSTMSWGGKPQILSETRAVTPRSQ